MSVIDIAAISTEITEEYKHKEKFYSLDDILQGYNISYSALRSKVKRGILKGQKLICNMDDKETYYKYIVPESELRKLEKLKFADPRFSPESQPEFYAKKRAAWKEKIEEWRIEREKWEKEHEALEREITEKREKRKKYQDYLESDEWRELRNERLKIDGYQCQMCGSGKNLCVHHITYENLHCDNEIDDLITLCRSCHDKVHFNDFLKRKEFSNEEYD